MTTRHAFVTGGTGFLGLNLIEQLIGQGWQVTALHPAHILGRYDRRGWARLIIAAHERWPPGVPSGARTFCHAEAIAWVQIAAVERGRTAQNYLTSGAMPRSSSCSA